MRVLVALFALLIVATAPLSRGWAQDGRPPPPGARPLPEARPPVTRQLPAAPDKAVVVIFNHGTNRPQFRHVCNEGMDVPTVMRDLAAKHGWLVHYLCSLAIDGNEPASYTYKRADEILALVAAYRAKGVPASRIFLAGHSAGGWSSLMAARKDHSGFNAIIAFAPAFAGTRAEQARWPIWRGEYLPRQIAYLRQAPRINALILAYSDDEFERPQDLKPLETIRGINLIAFDACNAGHGTTYSECFRTGARIEIEDYVQRRLAQP
jgi:pimeloyl-ACP methyl ester carboxylesterase